MGAQNITVARYLSSQLMICGKSQIEISNEIGYTNPNVITMFKQGKTKLPITKVKALANALSVDPVYLLKLVMTEYMPDTWDVISDILGGTIITKSEENILRVINQVADGIAIEPITDEEVAELSSMAIRWKERANG
jgi:hypothetical protein